MSNEASFTDRDLDQIALRVRRSIILAIEKASSGHPGGSLSCVEILVTLFFSVMRREPSSNPWPFSDRFILSKGHAEAAYYSVLKEAGLIDDKMVSTMRAYGSPLQGHPDPRWLPGLVEFAGGSLGQGLSFAAGLAGAICAKGQVFVLLGDGEIQEGQVWEAVLAVSAANTKNLTAIVDWNGFQLSGSVPREPSVEAVARAWAELGWATSTCDGHDMRALIAELTMPQHAPRAVFAKTVKGRGVSFMEGNNTFHGRGLTHEEAAAALLELGI